MEPPLTSTHSPLRTLFTVYTPVVAVGVTVNFWLLPLLQVNCCRNAPLVVELPVTSMHLLLCTARR